MTEMIGVKTPENGNAEPQKTGWEEVAAMADKMSSQTTSKEFNDENYDGMVDTSGRKYQSIEARANDINHENTREYGVDRRKQNYQMLLTKDKDLAELYKVVLTEFPELQNVELVNFDTKRETKNGKPNAFFNSIAKRDGQYRPIVKFNFDEPEVYYDGSEGGGDAMALAQSVKRIALSVGVDANEALKNRKFMTSFLLLHELGHALDFKKNYLDANNGNLAEAFRQSRESRRRDEMTMPVPGAVEVSNVTQEEKDGLHKRFNARFSGMGIHNSKQLGLVEARKYREMHCERMADGFARDYVLRHYGEFFTNSEKPIDGKLGTKFEKSMTLGEDFAEVLGIEEGLGMKFTLLSGPDDTSSGMKVGESKVGYLSNTAALGDRCVLQETNDPKRPGNKFEISSGIKTIAVMPHAVIRKDKNGGEHRGVENEVRFMDNERRIYKIEKARNQSKRIDGDNVEMLKDLNETLGLKAGSEVQLLKREVAGRGASPIQEGELKMGKLTTDGISLDGVEMVTDDGRKLRTSFVDSIYREWKTFYIDTATSTYEVIPVHS